MKRLLHVTAWLLLALAMTLLVALALTWAPDRPVSALADRWAPPPSTFVAIGGMQVHLRDEGPRDDPNPIILLHGTSSSLHTWEGWVPRLSQSRRVISLDLPGFGLTGPFPDGDYSPEAYTRFMRELMEAMALPPAVLVGNSFGALVATGVATSDPGRVHQLVLVDALAYPVNPESVPLGFRLAATPGVRTLMQYTLPRAMVAASVRDVFGDPSRVTPELVERYYEITLREGNRAALSARLRHLPSEGEALALRGIRQPTLILWGGRDRLIPPENGRRLSQDIAGSLLVMFPELGHVPQEEDPSQSLAPVLTFLGIP